MMTWHSLNVHITHIDISIFFSFSFFCSASLLYFMIFHLTSFTCYFFGIYFELLFFFSEFKVLAKNLILFCHHLIIDDYTLLASLSLSLSLSLSYYYYFFPSLFYPTGEVFFPCNIGNNTSARHSVLAAFITTIISLTCITMLIFTSIAKHDFWNFFLLRE